jgi:hypothetical protein
MGGGADVAYTSLTTFIKSCLNEKFFEKCRLLGYDAVWILLKPTFRRNVSHP